MMMNEQMAQMVSNVTGWWVVEWSAKTGVRCQQLRDVIDRNNMLMRDEDRGSGYDMLALFPSYQDALEHVTIVKRKIKEKRKARDTAGYVMVKAFWWLVGLAYAAAEVAALRLIRG